MNKDVENNSNNKLDEALQNISFNEKKYVSKPEYKYLSKKRKIIFFISNIYT